MSDEDSGSLWIVVSDFLLTVLTVFVMLYAGSQQKDPGLLRGVEAIKSALTQGQASGLLRQFTADDHEVAIIYSEQQLGFPPCGWNIEPSTAEQIRRHMELFEQVEKYINRLQIEGHADVRRPSSCVKLKFKTNFELSETRAMSVFAALIGKSIDDLDSVSLDTIAASGLLGRLAARQQVLVAGFGATRPVPGVPPEDVRNRRVEVRVTFAGGETAKPATQ